jgi:SAM-dependent methyltransferase
LTRRRTFDRNEGRRVFGLDPASYDAGRPGHPDRVYEVLVKRCGLVPGSRVLEIGPGTGQVTFRLLALGADVVAVEPDPRLAAFLRKRASPRMRLVRYSLEEADLPSGAFDHAVAASSFHWVDEEVGLAHLYAALRPNGWIALWWTLFGVADEPDGFITATSPLLEEIEASPSAGVDGGPPFALDVDARRRALDNAGFHDVRHETFRWIAAWDTAGIRALYRSFSPIARLDDERRTRILDALAAIAEQKFGGRVTRTLLTSLYTARKPS